MNQLENNTEVRLFIKTFEYLSTKMNEINIEVNAQLASLIDWKDLSSGGYLTVAEKEIDRKINEFQALISKVGTSQATLNRIVNQLIPEIPTSNVSNSTTDEVVETSLVPVNESINRIERNLDSFWSILTKLVSNKVFPHGQGSFDPQNSVLKKYAESLMPLSTDDIKDWPDGWYNCSDKEVELLITPEYNQNEYAPRIHIVFTNIDSIKLSNLIVRISDKSRWLTEELLSKSVSSYLRLNLMHELFRQNALFKTYMQEDPNNPANQLKA